MTRHSARPMRNKPRLPPAGTAAGVREGVRRSATRSMRSFSREEGPIASTAARTNDSCIPGPPKTSGVAMYHARTPSRSVATRVSAVRLGRLDVAQHQSKLLRTVPIVDIELKDRAYASRHVFERVDVELYRLDRRFRIGEPQPQAAMAFAHRGRGHHREYAVEQRLGKRLAPGSAEAQLLREVEAQFARCEFSIGHEFRVESVRLELQARDPV